MIPLLYNAALHAGAAVAAGPAWLWTRARRPRLHEVLPQRLGRTGTLPPRPAAPPLWLHGVSLGEVRALRPLVAAWTAAHPDRPLLVTASTETGLDAARDLFAPGTAVAAFPLDTPFAVRAHLDHWRPACVALLETELWPNFFWACGRRGIPLCVLSGRVGERTLRAHTLLGPLWRSVLACGAGYAMQTEQDAARLVALGAPPDRVRVLGNLKWDAAPTPAPDAARAWRAAWGLGPDAPLVLWGSTHAPEERLALQAWLALRAAHPAARLCVAPRHPERFDAVASTLAAPGVRLHRRSAGPARDWDVLLLDSVGELADAYPAATVAVMGGTFAPVGGHNIIEVLAAGVPLLVGPHTHHIRHLVRAALEAEAVLPTTEADVGDAVARLLDDAGARARLAANGRALLALHRGTAHRLLTFLEDHWPVAPPP